MYLTRQFAQLNVNYVMQDIVYSQLALAPLKFVVVRKALNYRA